MGIYQSLAGSVRVRVLTPDCGAYLEMLDREHIGASSVRIEDAVTLELTVARKDLKRVQQICRKKGVKLEIVHKKGLFWPLCAALRRPFLVGGMLLLLVMAVMLPGRILFITAEGNDAVPSRCIVEQAADCGLKFWSRRREIRSEQVKNALLEAIPQLQWVGVNTYGCRAVITVRERSTYESDGADESVSHIAAARDGLVRSCTVTRGFGNCKVGQAVRKGDILISGYTDCGLTYTAERAEGKILAQTRRLLRIVTPQTCQNQSPGDGEEARFSLCIGKKRINFYKGSGISGATCDKMYSKYVLTLPGGFELPVALLKERTVSCYLTETAVRNAESMLKDFAADYLMDLMTDGAILSRAETVTESEGICQLTGVYDCLENIGIVQEEKIGETNG